MPDLPTTQDLQQEIIILKKTNERLRLENLELRETANQADTASKAKSDFLAMISHEIRTPMNGVIGISELLLNTELHPRQKHFAQLILTSARSLLTLINSLLDFSKIEAHKMGLEIISFDLRDLLQQLLTLYIVSGKQKGIAVKLEVGEDVARYYTGDGVKLRQILVNLLGNSIKFTDNGQITLTVEHVDRQEDTDLLRFTVIDTGMGIAENALKTLFEPFVQADISSTRRFGGTGLGLSICSKLVELMGGRIEVKSESGKGSRFWFTLPFKPEKTGDIIAGPQLDFAIPLHHGQNTTCGMSQDDKSNTLRLLIVDDDQTNRIVMEEIFKDTPAKTYFAENGQQAISMCSEQSFAMIFMDCQMPVMDGFEATVRILEELKEKKRPVPPIIALTADATKRTHERCYDVGMVDYLVKPIDFRRLQEVLQVWLPDSEEKIHIFSTDDKSAVETDEENSVINRAALQKLEQHVGNIDNVVKVFVGALEQRTKALKAAFLAGRADEVQKYAHMLKGSSSQVGAEQLAKLCEAMEQAGRRGSLKEVRQLMPKIEHMVKEVLNFFKEQRN
ncbi:ATP-binding protein [Desulfogranum japonicum]|uniref:ATP-binding protein n=1 Tax=Desulfogranum japonicum TaxID=231447 RepID=UPI0004295BCC|nr:ATP-binding protein [Desulfogranum japonicum]